MRKSIFIIFFTLLCVFSARAFHFEADGIYYNIISGTEEVAVTSGTVKYSGAVVIPTTVTNEGTTYTVTSIGESAFEECTGLTSVTIPNSVTAIGKKAFYFCGDNLTSVTIGERVTSIGENAFRNCTGLTSVTLPEGVTSIGAYAFYYCTGLTSVNIPESVTFIGDQAFRDCPGLTSVTIPNGVTYIRDGTFSGCSGLTSVTIPEGVIYLGGAFSGCSGLTSVTIPESVTSIGNGAFSGCTGLTSITIPNRVTSIGYNAFDGCTGLTSITIPASVTKINREAFLNCTALTSVTCLAQTPISYSSSYPAFSVYDTLFVPRGCKNAYQTAKEWEKFAVIKETPSLVTLLVNNEVMGVVTGDGEYAYGMQATLEATPNAGYHFVKWNDENTDNPRTLTVTADITLTAEFAPNIYTVTVHSNDASMGTVSGGNTYAFGSSATLEAVPNTGYHFVKWSDENTDNPRTLTVAGDITLTAEFAINTYTLTAQTNDAAMGTVSGGNEYAHGAEATLEAIPNEGYHFVKWSDENTDNPRMLTVSGDITLTAEFTPNIYTVTAQANDADMGTVTGGDTYAFGTEAMLEAVSNPGYHFVKWNDGNTDNPRTLTVTQDTTLMAEFAINTFTVSVSANKPEWGSVSQSGNGTYDSASSVTITATPNDGYRFINWTKGEAVFSTQADTTFTVTENLTLLANFEKIPDEPIVIKTFTLSVSANNPAWGRVSQSGNGTYDSASSVTITATPNEGYRFINWTKGEAVFSTQAEITFMVTENLTLLANFEKIPDEPVANENRQDDHFRVYAQDRTILLSEARGLVQVYNMAGQCVYNGYSTTIPVRQSGVYIVAVGPQRFKVLVR